jgi:RimJ/RimL family protein N-acetyltransferase
MASLVSKVVHLRDGRAVTLRSATAADAHAVVAMMQSVANERGYTFYEPDEIPDAARSIIKRIEESVDDEDNLRLIACDECAPAHVVGELSLTAGNRRRIAHSARLGMEIRRDYRSIGLGSAMLDRAIEWATSHPRVFRIELGVLCANAPAVALYTKHGFHKEGIRVKAFDFGDGRYEDDMLMARSVKQF